jgi:hypothetical protein
LRILSTLLLIMLAAIPSMEAKSATAQCRKRCVVEYKFCLNRSTTKQARRECKVLEKTCKGTCGGGARSAGRAH